MPGLTNNSVNTLRAVVRDWRNTPASIANGRRQFATRPMPSDLITPHLATRVSTTGITVGLSRGITGVSPEFVYVSHRGAITAIAKSTAEALTGITASGYIVYELACAAGTWTATAVFSTTLTALADANKIYVVIAQVTCAGSVITAVYQQLYDNPTVHIGSPQYSITVDTANGRLQFQNDSQVPPPMSFYGTDQNGVKGWHSLCALIAACAGEDPEDGQPCGECAAEDCYKITGFATDMFEMCANAVGVTGALWDGRLIQTSSAGQPCAYTGSMILEPATGSGSYLCSYSLVQYLNDATCTWRLTILNTGTGATADPIVWQGEHTNAAPDGAAFTYVQGCDATASISIEYCYAVSCGTLDPNGYRIAGYDSADFDCASCPDATTEPEWDGTFPLSLSPACGFANEHWVTENVTQIAGELLYGAAAALDVNYDGAGHDRWIAFATCGASGSTSIFTYLKYEGDTPAGEYTKDDWRGYNPGYAASCAGPSTITVEAIP